MKRIKFLPFGITAFLLCVSIITTGCSLAPSAANRSYKAYDNGDYKESIRLVNRALSTYEYDDLEKANLLYLKAQGYAKLNSFVDAAGVLAYILKHFPDTEAAYRATVLMSVLKNKAPKPPVKKKPTPKRTATEV